MCRFKSALVLRDERVKGGFRLLMADDTDHHSVLMERHGLSDSKVTAQYARVEFVPLPGEQLTQFAKYHFVLDEERTPRWWSEEIQDLVKEQMTEWLRRRCIQIPGGTKVLFRDRLFDVGYELELFLTSAGSSGPINVWHAATEMKRRLGFDIDQNHYAAGSLRLCPGWTLRTDGTPIELQLFDSSDPAFPIDVMERLAAVEALKGLTLLDTPLIREGRPVTGTTSPIHFIEPGPTYSSEKLMRNAYTGKDWRSEKKDDPTTVTMRTAGLHIHWSVATLGGSTADQAALSKAIFAPDHRLTDGLIKVMDGVYTAQFGTALSPESRERVADYQPLGDYRIKDSGTESGLSTLEYRQLDASMARDPKELNRFVTSVQRESVKYLREALKGE